MSEIQNPRVLELIASKICHDLISPVGAVSNGVEIMTELGEASDDITDLIAFSAGQANAKLKTLRMAYGLGGADDSIKAEDVHKIFEEFISGENRITQNWDPYADLGLERKSGFAKIVLCALLLLIEALPKGGELKIEADQDNDNTMLISAEGENAHFRENFINALNHNIDIQDLDPKLVHAYATGLFARHYGFEISIDETKNNFIFLRLKSSPVSWGET